MFSFSIIGSPVFRTSHEGPDPGSPRQRLAFTPEATRKGAFPGLLSPSEAFKLHFVTHRFG